MRFAQGWGYDWLHVVNLFAFRATDPAEMRMAEDPVGPYNDARLVDEASAADMVILAWGKNGAFRNRANRVLELLAWRELHCLALNGDGSPKHPLYIRADASPVKFEMQAAA